MGNFIPYQDPQGGTDLSHLRQHYTGLA